MFRDMLSFALCELDSAETLASTEALKPFILMRKSRHVDVQGEYGLNSDMT